MHASVFDKTFQPLFGQPCWGLEFAQCLNLSMNFGKPRLRIREPHESKSNSEIVRRIAARRKVTVRGEWWLWLYCCYWRLTWKDELLATGSSSFKRIERGMAQLGGQALCSIRVLAGTGATRFTFDLGCVLECRRFDRGKDAEIWMLYKPNGYVLSVSGDETFSHHRGNAKAKHPVPIEETVLIQEN